MSEPQRPGPDLIRTYADDDLEPVLDVWYRASLIAHSFLAEDFFAEERRMIAQRWLPASDTIVAVIGQRIVGFLSLVGDEVGAIFVDPDEQGRGIGRALMDRAARSHPSLELEVFEANPIGRRFYAAYGFHQIERRFDDALGQPLLRLRFDSPAAFAGGPDGP